MRLNVFCVMLCDYVLDLYKGFIIESGILQINVTLFEGTRSV